MREQRNKHGGRLAPGQNQRGRPGGLQSKLGASQNLVAHVRSPSWWCVGGGVYLACRKACSSRLAERPFRGGWQEGVLLVRGITGPPLSNMDPGVRRHPDEHSEQQSRSNSRGQHE